jgi:probable rRNA maturation factor
MGAMSSDFFPDDPGGSVDDLMDVSIADQQSRIEINPDSLLAAAKRILQDADYLYGELSIAVVDDPTIHRLNREYLQHDYPTDVLSFLLEEGGNRLIGQVILSTDTAAREAAKVGWSTETELLLYVIHGTLHLVGYDDLADAPRGEMRRAERHYLIESGVPAEQIDERLPSAFVDGAPAADRGDDPENVSSRKEPAE